MMNENFTCNSEKCKRIIVENVHILLIENRNYSVPVEQVLVKGAPIIRTNPESLKQSFMKKLNK